MAIDRNKEWGWMDIVENRPWGMYEILLDSPECKVKRITVDPGQKLSYQYHYKRQKPWTVVKGNLTIVLDDEQVVRKAGG